MCMVCFMPPQTGFGNQLIKHHVSYIPEVIAFVHYECHKRIHDTEKPIKCFIQYNEGDARKFYEKKKEMMTQ